MDHNTPFNLMIFTNETKKICMCTILSIVLIILFIISPLSNLFLTSVLMKIIASLILLYTIYINNNQTQLLKQASLGVNSEIVKNQLNINLICSYIFTLFIGILIIFVIKSFF
jgi:hypothetical protein